MSRDTSRARWQSSRVFGRRAMAMFALAAAAGGSVAAPTALATVDAPVDGGAVIVTDSVIRTESVTHGNDSTLFTLRLPDGASCPGDSANDQWRVQSFLIPIADDPMVIQYGAIGPEPSGDGRYALFRDDTRPFVHQLTRRNEAVGSPGIIPALPAFSFAAVAGERIPTGTYRIGIACTYFGKTAVYWHTEVALTEPATGTKDTFTWRLTTISNDVFASDNNEAGWVTPLVFGGLAIAVVGGLLWVRRNRRSASSPPIRSNTKPSNTTLSKESQ